MTVWYIICVGNHSHQPVGDGLKWVHKKRAEMKLEVRMNPTRSVRQTYNEVYRELPNLQFAEEAAANFPTFDKCRSALAKVI